MKKLLYVSCFLLIAIVLFSCESPVETEEKPPQNNPPIITLIGGETDTVFIDSTYQDNYSAFDEEDGDLTDSIKISYEFSRPNITYYYDVEPEYLGTTKGECKITYSVRDSERKLTSATRYVHVIDSFDLILDSLENIQVKTILSNTFIRDTLILTKENSPYEINVDMRIDTSGYLIIEEGVSFKFTKIIVDGVILANGTLNEPIILSGNNIDLSRHTIDNINYKHNFNYCKINSEISGSSSLGSFESLSLTDSYVRKMGGHLINDIVIADCKIDTFSQDWFRNQDYRYGPWQQQFENVTITNSVIKLFNYGQYTNYNDKRLILTNSVISEFAISNLIMASDSIENNRIKKIIISACFDDRLTKSGIRNNSIYPDNPTDSSFIIVGKTSTSSKNTVDLRGNYWGDYTQQLIGADEYDNIDFIFDFNDNVNYHRVLFSDFQTTSPETFNIYFEVLGNGDIFYADSTLYPDSLTVDQGSQLNLRFQPYADYQIDSVVIDGVNKGSLELYTLRNIQNEINVKAYFGR